MPVDMRRYPANWKEIRAKVQSRAGDRCEWCRVPNGVFVYRINGSANWYEDDLDTHHMNSSVAESLGLYDARLVRIVCTTAHLGVDREDGTPGDKHDKMDNRMDNLAFLCQACHLGYDIKDHVSNAHRTRRRRRMEAGQLALSEELVG